MSKGKAGYPWESTRDIYQQIPPIYGLYNGFMGQYGSGTFPRVPQISLWKCVSSWCDAAKTKFIEVLQLPFSSWKMPEKSLKMMNFSNTKTLRIQVCPKKGITLIFLFFSDGIGTINPLRSGGIWILRENYLQKFEFLWFSTSSQARIKNQKCTFKSCW